MNNKILLIKLGALGDVISFSPIPSLIKQCLPSSRIDHLVYNYASEISQSNSEIVNTISLNPNLSFFRKFFEFIRLVLHLRQQKYHYVFIFHRSFALQFFAFIIRGKFIYGFKSKFNFFLSNHIEYDSNVNTTVLQARLICDSLKLIYSNPPLLNYEFDISNINEINSCKLSYDNFIEIAKGLTRIEPNQAPFLIIYREDDYWISCRHFRFKEDIREIHMSA